MRKQVGALTISVATDGWPMWVVVTDGRGREISFHHNELPDLLYAVQSAQRAVDERSARPTDGAK